MNSNLLHAFDLRERFQKLLDNDRFEVRKTLHRFTHENKHVQSRLLVWIAQEFHQLQYTQETKVV